MDEMYIKEDDVYLSRLLSCGSAATTEITNPNIDSQSGSGHVNLASLGHTMTQGTTSAVDNFPNSQDVSMIFRARKIDQELFVDAM